MDRERENRGAIRDEAFLTKSVRFCYFIRHLRKYLEWSMTRRNSPVLKQHVSITHNFYSRASEDATLKDIDIDIVSGRVRTFKCNKFDLIVGLYILLVGNTAQNDVTISITESPA